MLTQQPITGSYVTEYKVPTSTSGPYAIAAGANSTLWFTEYYEGKLASIDSNSGVIHEYALSEANPQLVGVVVDNRNLVWVADENGPGRIWLFDPSNASFIRSYSGRTNNATDFFVTVDANDNVWFSELTGNNIGEIPFDSVNVIEYPLPTPNSGPSVIAIQNGTSYLWISEYYTNKIARFDMLNHSWKEYDLSPIPKNPLGLALDSAGNIWLAEHGGSSVDRYIVSSSTFTQYPTANAVDNITAPATVSVDRSDRVWFVEHVANKVGRLDPKTGSTDEFVFPTPGYSLQGFGSTLDSKGDFWFTLFSGNAIGVIRGNTQSPLHVRISKLISPSVTAGDTLQVEFNVSNLQQTPVTVAISSTSTLTGTDEITFSSRSVMIPANGNETLSSTIRLDSYTFPRAYGIGIVATYANASSIATIFLTVRPSILYQLTSYLPEITAGIIAIIAVAVFLIIRTMRHKQFTIQGKRMITSSKVVSFLTIFLVVIFYCVSIVSTAEGKCPGLPQPPVQPGGTSQAIDYYGVGLDVATAVFFGIVAYLLIRDRMKRRKMPPNGSGSTA